MEDYSSRCKQIRTKSERVWKDELLSLKRKKCEKLNDEYNTLSEEYDAWLDYCPNCVVGCGAQTREEWEGYILGAMLKLIIAMEEKGCEYPSDIDIFTENEKNIVKEMERFSKFDRENLTPVRIDEILQEKGEIYTLLKEAVYKQYIDYHELGKIWKSDCDDGIRNPLITLFEETYRRRFDKVKKGLVEYMNHYPTSFVHLFRDYEEAIMDSVKIRSEASEVERRVDRGMKEFMEHLSEMEDKKTELEEKVAELEKELWKENIEKDTLLKRIEELKGDRETLMESLSGGFEDIEGHFRELEKAKRALEEEKNKLEKKKEEFKEEARAEVENEIALLQEQIEKYRKALLEKDKIRESLEQEKNTLKEKMSHLTAIIKGEEESRPVSAEEARAYEVAFIGKFQDTLTSMQYTPNPITKKKMKVKRWNKIMKNSLEKIKKMGAKNENILPLNTSCRYAIEDGFINKKITGIIEAISLNHLTEYIKNGMDVKKASLGDLLQILNERIDRAQEGKYFHIIGIESPTGWNKKAIDFVLSKEYKNRFFDRYVYLYLVDMESGKVYYNTVYNDLGLYSYAKSFKPYISEEEVKDAEKTIKDELLKLKKERGADFAYITMNKAIKICRKDRGIIKSAFVRLQDKNFGEIGYLKDEGIVLKLRGR